ncbi:helix-turn-helix transcriptional regulator [Methylovirgula sp. 4M-Z18]|uniref:helix-turn-helix transcriptional regulator n=1 Tax=Methylovirgula sp. 4M-Z18 TaxID=2293567 RepID=UPI000E2E6C51|nr:AraC family transcriptional regulator [Methylovirgula sp. 4M-Z18]RFB78939.1 AraC family transcriptional regulator [Methylovirgula sp. 4M-Z18]
MTIARPADDASDPDPRILHRARIGTAGTVLQHQALVFKRLFFDRPMVIFIARGEKTVRWAQGEQTFDAGSAVAVPAGLAVDVINRPDPEGIFRSQFVVIDEALVRDHAALHRGQPVLRTPAAIVHAAGAMERAIEAAASAVGDPDLPDSIARHRVAEVLLWIGLACGRFDEPGRPTVTARVRRLVGADLGRDWSAGAIAAHLAMSEPTMRRKLAAEATSLSAIIGDMRLSQALSLLQSTGQSVTQIAGDVGYKTPSHFAARFQQRFGFAPTAVRQHKRETARELA